MVGVNKLKERRNDLAALQRAAESDFLRLAIAGAGVAAFDWAIADDILTWSGAELLTRNRQPPNSFTSGQSFLEWLGHSNRAMFLSLLEQSAAAEPSFTLECELPSRGGREWLEFRGIRVLGDDGRTERLTGVVSDITEQKNAMTHLSYLSSCDELTGQMSRSRLREELARLLARADAKSRPIGYVVVAIDRLAVINEAYGFDVADEVIIAAGKRLAGVLRGKDLIGRTAGNKFGVILGDASESDLSVVAERLQAAVREEAVETRAGAVSATVSIGAIWLPAAAATSHEAMHRAEEALERAKTSGRNGFAVYTRSERREASRRQMMTIADEIVAALDEQRIVIAYQPIVDSRTRETAYYECLLRMVRRDGSIANAGEFIPAAETLGLVRLCDRRALEIAVAQLTAHPDIRLSLNVSGTTAGDHAWLKSYVGYLRENSAVANRLTVELTETAALQAFEESTGFLTGLHELGCRVAIDDFGAGYTSFRNLHAMRFDVVKIDGSYIQNLSKSSDNQLFVRMLVELAKNFGIETVAEWVDSEEDAAVLVRLGVDYFQGFYFGRPEITPTWLAAAPAPKRIVA